MCICFVVWLSHVSSTARSSHPRKCSDSEHFYAAFAATMLSLAASAVAMLCSIRNISTTICGVKNSFLVCLWWVAG